MVPVPFPYVKRFKSYGQFVVLMYHWYHMWSSMGMHPVAFSNCLPAKVTEYSPWPLSHVSLLRGYPKNNVNEMQLIEENASCYLGYGLISWKLLVAAKSVEPRPPLIFFGLSNGASPVSVRQAVQKLWPFSRFNVSLIPHVKSHERASTWGLPCVASR